MVCLTDWLSAEDAFGGGDEEGGAGGEGGAGLHVQGAGVGAGGVATALLVVMASLAAGTLG